MNEHGLIPSDYTERPIYQTERSLELQHNLEIGCDMADDMLRLPYSDSVSQYHETIKDGGSRLSRKFAYVHPGHQEEISLNIEYETRPAYKSEVYSISVDAASKVSDSNEGSFSTYYVLQKNAGTVTSAFIQTVNLEKGGHYADRRMTVYDARQMFNELVEFSVVACQYLESE
jgi:hypothetical protein